MLCHQTLLCKPHDFIAVLIAQLDNKVRIELPRGGSAHNRLWKNLILDVAHDILCSIEKTREFPLQIRMAQHFVGMRFFPARQKVRPLETFEPTGILSGGCICHSSFRVKS